MSEILTVAASLGGVVLGGAISVAGAHFLEQRRWRRETAARWDQRQLDVALDISASIDALHKTALAMTARRRGSTRTPVTRPEGIEQHDRITAGLRVRRQALRLLGDRAMIDTMGLWYDAVLVEMAIARTPDEDFDPEQFAQVRAHVEAMRDQFHEAARARLGVL